MKHLSASSLIQYCDCSLKWKFIYVDKLFKPSPSIHLVYGSAVHKALEMLNLSLINQKIELEDVFQEFHNEWYNELKKQGLKESFYTDKLYLMGINTLERYYNEQLNYKVIGAEIEFEVPIEEKIYNPNNYTLYGLIDLVLINDKNQLIIVDYKTSKEEYNKFKIDTSIQLAIYSYAFRYILQKGILNINKKKEDYIAYYLLLKDYDTLNGEIKIQKKKITDFSKMLYIIETSLKGIDNNIFLPNYNSECQYCEYRKECLEFK